jgi:hypothetical protein
MDPRLDRILKLLALATKNPNVEEARSAAVKCLELMVEHGVVITLPAPKVSPAQPPPPPPPPGGLTYDALRDLMRQQAQQNPYRQQSSSGWWYNPYGGT